MKLQEREMNTRRRTSPSHESGHAPFTETTSRALPWALIAIAVLLLVGFTTVVEDITKRGEMRRVHQRVSGSLLLPSERSNNASEALRLVSLNGQNISAR